MAGSDSVPSVRTPDVPSTKPAAPSARPVGTSGNNGINTAGTVKSEVEALQSIAARNRVGAGSTVGNVGRGAISSPVINYSSPTRPGGHITHDVNPHGFLSPQANRAPGFANTKADNFVQSHHPVQDKWAKVNVPGYDSNAAPETLLESASGMQHAKISAAQRALRRDMKTNGLDPYGTSIRQEFNSGYKQMIDAGVPQNVARKAIKDSYKYFGSLGAFN